MFAGLGFLALFGSVQADPTAEALRERIELFRATGELELAGGAVASMAVAPVLYERRDFRPAWTSRERVEELITLVGRAGEHGLDPVDYHHPILVAMSQLPLDHPEQRADFDLLLTDGLARYGYHMVYGKVDPVELDSNWNLSRELKDRDPATVMQVAIDSESIEEMIERVVGERPLYDRMRELLAEYRRLAAAGGWPGVSSGSVLKVGMVDARVRELRARLVVTEPLSASPVSSQELYDPSLEEAVKRFQQRHGLDADGAVGPATLAALNVTADARVDQIRVNLERLRWVFRDIPTQGALVVVNIAAFRAALVRDRELVWQARVQVGKPYRKTPVFRGEIEYLVFNPTWTVPPTILSKDILPKVRRDVGYLAVKGIRVLDRSGRRVDPNSLEWASFTGKNFPYILRQDPGPDNALGLVKFIFPNSHFVFLHDTPHREGFAHARRTFSSGCIRVDRPFELAELLLDDPQWGRRAIDELVAAGETRTLFLSDPVPVLLLYGTVGLVGERPQLLPDVYQRDSRVLEALNEPFRFVPPTVAENATR